MDSHNGALAPISMAISALKDVRHPLVRKAITGYSLGVAAWSGYAYAKSWHRNRYAYTVAVDSREELYSDVQRWLLNELPQTEIRSMYASKNRSPGTYDATEGVFRSPTAELLLFYDGTKEQTVCMDGHNILVSITDDDKGGEADKKTFRIKTQRIMFTAHSEEGQSAVITKLKELANKAEAEQTAPRFMMANKWGDWIRRNDLEARTLDTVILPAGQKETLIEDISLFLRLKDKYLKYGIPYHRGYMFEGPPGTGKTSLAKALATHFSLDVYYIPLSDMDQDTGLLSMIAAVPPGSVLLLEDVDVFHAIRERADDLEVKGITLSGLLNSLDGVSTPSGLITVMTTNRVEVLDDAIIRPGRVDRVEHIGFLDDHQLKELVVMFLGHNHFELPPLGKKEVTPAGVAEIVKRHLEDPEMAFKQLKKFLKKA